MSKVIVDQEKCIGCGACVAIDPENFDFNEDGISTVIKEEATDSAKEAEEACPVYAIDIIENENCKCNHNDCCNDCDCDDCDCDCDDCDCDCDCCEDCDCGDNCTCNDECHCSENCTCNN